MDMETFNSIDPVIWIIVAAAGSICIFVLLNKAIKKLLKLIVIGALLLGVVYFLVQYGVIELPDMGK